MSGPNPTPPDPAPARSTRVALPPGPFDVAILGAGAAGLWAAGTAAGRGRRVLLVEKNARPGVKVLASGGGHCNLTTTLDAEGAIASFPREQRRWLAPSVRALPPEEVRAEFLRWGVPTRAEPELEKVWPVSMRARDVLDALVKRAQRAGATIALSAAVTSVAREGSGFFVRTTAGDFAVPRVLVTVGGRSYPRTGTTGDGYPWMEDLGHTVTRPVPALAPLVVETPWVRSLAGVSLWARVLAVEDGETVAERRRPLLFTHTGLSGPGPMDVSRWFELAAPWNRPALFVDFLPDLPEDAARAALSAAIEGDPRARVRGVLPGSLPARLSAALCEAAGVAPDRRAGETSKAERHALLQSLKRCPLPVAGTRGFDFAEVAAGGVALPEVDPKAMASRIVPSLFVAGEILDVDGPIGGFNFLSAFSTAEAAGRSL